MSFVSNTIKSLPPYLFAEFQKKKKELQESGVDVIDLGIGAPDLPTPQFIIEILTKTANTPENHRYSPFTGCDEFKLAVANFYKKHYNVTLDTNHEILTLIGSKEGIAHLVQAVINPGDHVLVPNPGYPVYRTAVHLAGGQCIDLLLDKHHHYVPLFNQLTHQEIKKAKLMFLNYPNNPTSATVDLHTFSEIILFSKKNQVLVAHDAAYDLMTFNDYQSPSIMQVPGAKDIAVEFGSLSKSFNMTGWRIGYVVGNKQVIQALTTLKSNLDTSQFLPIQLAAATALNSDLSVVKANNKIIEKRMEVLYQFFNSQGFGIEKPRGTLFLWVRVPKQFTDTSFAELLLEDAGIIVTPGSLFGTAGKNHIRIALTVAYERIAEVINRLKSIPLKGE